LDNATDRLLHFNAVKYPRSAFSTLKKNTSRHVHSLPDFIKRLQRASLYRYSYLYSVPLHSALLDNKVDGISQVRPFRSR